MIPKQVPISANNQPFKKEEKNKKVMQEILNVLRQKFGVCSRFLPNGDIFLPTVLVYCFMLAV